MDGNDDDDDDGRVVISVKVIMVVVMVMVNKGDGDLSINIPLKNIIGQEEQNQLRSLFLPRISATLSRPPTA